MKDKGDKYEYEFDQKDIENYQAIIRYKSGSEIGRTNLELNARGEIQFLLRTQAQDGGFVLAQIVNKTTSEDISEISEPVENSTFTVIRPEAELSLIYPIDNILIDETIPEFNWTNPEIENASYYEIYLKRIGDVNAQISITDLIFSKDNLLSSIDNINTTSFIPEDELEKDSGYIWQLIAFYPDGERVAVSEIEYFKIDTEPVPPTPIPTQEHSQNSDDILPTPTDIPITAPDIGLPKGENPNVVDTESKINNQDTSYIIPSIFLTPLVIVILSSLPIYTLINASNIISRLGILIGILFPQRKKYWGIVFDPITSKGIPFAKVELRSIIKNEVISSTFTNSDGKYILSAKYSGEYTLKVSAQGYDKKTKDLSIQNHESIKQDFVLSRKESSHLSKIKKLLFYNKRTLINIFKIIYIVLVFIGLIFSIIATVLFPIIFNFAILILYSSMFMAFILSHIRKFRTQEIKILNENSNKAIKNAIVRVFKPNGEIGIYLSNKSGVVMIPNYFGINKELIISHLDYKSKHIKTSAEVIRINPKVN
jgi:hypothetical protein